MNSGSVVWRMSGLRCIAWVCLMAMASTSWAEGTSEDAEDEGVSVAGIPVVTFNSDDGLGGGLLGAVFYNDGTLPYRYAATVLTFYTTKGVQAHELKLDAIDLLQLPLRVTSRVGFFHTISYNYCGLGNDVTCDVDDAKRAASIAQLSPLDDDYDAFVRTYHQTRFMRLWGLVDARYTLYAPLKLQAFAGARLFFHQPGALFGDDGSFLDLTRYPGSLLERHTTADSQTGLASVVQLGLMFDTRDNEPAPTRGFWVEASVRAATPFWGSKWTFAGANVTARSYVPLASDGSVVLAHRLVVDVMVGDMPVQEMVRVGGTWDYTAFGGLEAGRGIRIQRNIGRVKAMQQSELRVDVFEWALLGQNFKHTLVGFLDAASIGVDVTDWGGRPFKVNLAAGMGTRFAWNESFVLRADVGFSPDENYAPGIYLAMNNVF